MIFRKKTNESILIKYAILSWKSKKTLKNFLLNNYSIYYEPTLGKIVLIINILNIKLLIWISWNIWILSKSWSV